MPQDEKTGLERLPLTVLALAYQRGLCAHPQHFQAIVHLLIVHMHRFPRAIQVLLREDLKNVHATDGERLREIEEMCSHTETPELRQDIETRNKRLLELNDRSPRDARGCRLYALNREMTSPPWYPKSPTHVLTLADIAQRWETLSCQPERLTQRQGELQKAVHDLLLDVCNDIDDTMERSHAAVLFDLFPAPLLQAVFKTLELSQQAKLLRRIPVNANSLPLVVLYANKFSIDASNRRKLLGRLLEVEQAPDMRKALTDLYEGVDPRD